MYWWALTGDHLIGCDEGDYTHLENPKLKNPKKKKRKRPDNDEC